MAKFQIIRISILFILMFSCQINGSDEENDDFYSLTVKDSQGSNHSLARYRGKVTLVTNVASECGYTDLHYEAFVKMQVIFNKKRNLFSVLAFPCNQFGEQEPAPVPYIQKWAKEKYALNFPIFEKVNVIGENVDPIWKFLADRSGHEPTWNFWKYLISPNGRVINAWSPRANLQTVFKQIKEEVEKLSGTEIKDEL